MYENEEGNKKLCKTNDLKEKNSKNENKKKFVTKSLKK